MQILKNWPRIVFIAVPLMIALVDGTVLLRERIASVEQKAIRLVKESSSRKENFTVQQYLYTTVYHRLSRGESVWIQGWRTEPLDSRQLMVDFKYSDDAGDHVASWLADLEQGSVSPKNETALELSWH